MKSIILLTALGLTSATLAVAAPEGRGHGQGLKAADTNGDGMVSRDEAKALPRLAKHFDQIDADKNGQITAEEMKAAHQARRNASFDKLDANKDGVLSRDEFSAGRMHRAAK